MDQYAGRKATARIRVVDEKGNAVKNTEFQAELKNHEFLFGCGAFDAIPLTNEKKKDAFYEERMGKWLELYNYGTMSFYWGRYEERENEPAFESRMNASAFLKAQGKTVKGHPLCWHTVCADWLLQYDNKTILDKQLARIDRDVRAFAGVIDMWDVINEVVIMPEFDKYDNAVTRICKEYGRLNLVKEVFAAAKAANPQAVLLINDFNLSDRYAQLIAECLEAGVAIDAIGLQTHQHQGYMGREKLEEIVERFAGFGLPLHFTENTLVSGHIMPAHIVDLNDYQIPEWPTTPEGEKRQAEEMEDMYRFLFAHPSVEAITGWDFTDGAWLGAPSGVLRADNSEKPSYHMLKELIHKEWHTSEKLHTDENGIAALTGFKGSYTLTGESGSGEFHLGQGEECVVVHCS